MTTTVQFGPYLAATDLAISSRAVVGPKGSIQLADLPALAKVAPFSTLDPSVTEPLRLKEGGASSVTVWTKSGNAEALTQVTFAEFDNKLSRNMGILRVDTLRATVASAVAATGNAQLTIVVQSAQEAFAAGLAAARNWPTFDKKSGKKAADRTVYIDFHVTNGEQVNFAEIQAVANGIRNTQRYVDMPPADFNTIHFVAEAKRVAESLNALPNKAGNVSIEVIQGEELRDRGFGGLWGVGKAGEYPPALVILTYEPTTETSKTVALVGKGIVFDCGGLSLKPSTAMCGMKTDMGGAGAVFGAFQAIVSAGLTNTKVHALLCLAENAIDSKSFRNDDVLVHYSGKSTEVNNTDAEGRLVLADGVAYATKHLNPDAVIDIATLTGAQLITTGKIHAGIVSRTESAEAAMLAAGKVTGDVCFPMLYAPDLLLAEFKSEIADLTNNVKNRMNAQSSCAGHFVEAHLAEEYKGEWVHVDIAGPSADAKTRGTGFGAALLYQYVKNF
ncbi:cytosol aminopeptidase family, catalytic domain-domain-containing protein [Catenaria anguillulae PL171]|uniref:Cytosol aminopeptidase family, catalytic domain-domain-containing protein n=1 Tax=Catenaria anguillulae PL171 TaxID=765915 RepID=A0A1Y2HZQ6_9FUNG|nr:cytosol aminopeptidase family, catalytic domain-domain-containing protein [Catenaria anguillulae PL171]